MKRNVLGMFYKASILLVLLSIACSKDRIVPLSKELPPSDTKVDSIEKLEPVFIASANNVFAEWAVKPTKKTIANVSDFPFQAEKGTLIWASDYDFLFQDGTYAPFPIQLEVLELLTPMDMILNKKPTVSNGQLLTTGGQVNIRAYKDGKELKLSRWNNFKISLPADQVDESMGLFYGVESSDGTVNWEESRFVENPRDTFELRSPIFPGKGTYEIFPTQIGWINVDKFYSYTGPKTTIKFFSSKPEINSIMKFLYFDEIKSVAQIYGEESLPVPVGQSVKVICLSKTEDGKYYSYTEEFVVKENQVVNIEVKETTADDFLNYLETL